MNDCAPGERISLEGDRGEMKLEIFQDRGFAGFTLANSE